MENNDQSNEPSNVVKATRNAVVGAGEGVQALKHKTAELAHKVAKKWGETKPRRQKAADDLKETAERVAGFGSDVGEGIKEGFAELKKRNTKGTTQR